MTRYSAIRMFMFAFALLGLLLGPMAVSVSGAAMADQNMPIAMGVGDKVETAGMPVDMSCCPEKQLKVPDCSKDCPLNVLCVTGFSSLSTVDVDTFSIFGQKNLFHLAVFEALASRIGDPPHRPPSL